ncbi:Sporulenol synthase [Symmachiella dynata]|uniref:Sporulenol synthase n=1 Tax=Symmachiella dynata TaxID=2527995 RepID=A0A517ZV94_9PLAN|nr:prenyltransferase/squalene oxidase repeat-containing protein [Symmachiella dynata]QDU46398.1 Sporulenol synthase [Symmachiella dynata]
MFAQSPLTLERIEGCYQTAAERLLSERNAAGHWEGELSTSALSTATAVMALHMVQQHSTPATQDDQNLIDGGLQWLVDHQNDDGGWGDTVKSLSNISTTMLAHAVFHATGTVDTFSTTVTAARDYIDTAGGVPAVIARYGKDKTFSVPILTHCALAGLVDWSEVSALPFELACIPPQFYKTIRLPVVSYALPALIAIGQVRFQHRKPWFLPLRWLRQAAIGRSLRLLKKIQPTSGGFLEAAPLTSFVTMSLAGCGLTDHPVVRQGVKFLRDSVRPDGSWPIDTNLATWTTTLSVNALQDDLSVEDQSAIRDWLLQQQYREVHPYTNADPGGWAWTDLSGGVPDADDTPGAILALLKLRTEETIPADEAEALAAAVNWLLDLQNRDGGWPTFCRGWGALPFDRSAADLTAHAIRALLAWKSRQPEAEPALLSRSAQAIQRGFAYLSKVQRADGSWLPLWFGNQFSPDDENPVYGTARVLAAYAEAGRYDSPQAQQGLKWIKSVQNSDGGWGGNAGISSSVEETALAVEAILAETEISPAAGRGVGWLVSCVDGNEFARTTPIGFYFAKLWYFERLYPIIFTVAALGCARAKYSQTTRDETFPTKTPLHSSHSD